MRLLLVLKIFFYVVGRKILQNASFFICNQNKNGLFRLEHMALTFLTCNSKKPQNDLKEYTGESIGSFYFVEWTLKFDSAGNFTITTPILSAIKLILRFLHARQHQNPYKKKSSKATFFTVFCAYRPLSYKFFYFECYISIPQEMFNKNHAVTFFFTIIRCLENAI